jgi:hypothetical protein
MIQRQPRQQLEQTGSEQHTEHIFRRSLLKIGAVTAGVLTFGGTANAMSIASPSASISSGDTAAVMGDGSTNTSETLITQLNAVYVATRNYQNIATAREDGYAPAMVVPNVGHVYAIPDRIGDGNVDVTEPEALIYVDTRTTGCKAALEDANLDLAAIEYVVPGDQSANPPDLFADETASHQLMVTEAEGWHYNEEVDVTGLHVWLHHWNLAGLFNLTNPAVSEGSSLKRRTDQ